MLAMLVIRPEQMQVFRGQSLRTFEDEMLAHLRQVSETIVRVTGDDQIRLAIRLGFARAASYGFTLRGPVRLYIEMMLLFGSYFDTDLQYSWAGATLREEDGERERARRLFEQLLDYRSHVGGPNDTFALNALKRLAARARASLPEGDNDIVESIYSFVASIYPEKAAYLGDARMRAVIHHGIATARRLGFSSRRAELLVVVLAFVFGHENARDPVYPWIAATLEDPLIVDVEARARRLEKKALTWLDHALTLVP